MIFVTALLVLVIVDLEHQLLPDAITLPGTLVAFLASFLPGSPVDPLESGLAAGLGYVAFAALAWTWRRLRGIEALGEGDWKMAAMLGALLGAERLMLVLLIASSAGALVGLATILLRRGGWQSKLPFGTFLGLAAILVVYAGEPLAPRLPRVLPWLTRRLPPAKGLGVLLVLAVVALFEVLSLLQGVRSLRRLQGRVVSDAEAQLAAARPLLDAVLARGGPGAWDEAAAVAVERQLASEVEVVDAHGRSLFSRPAVAPVSYDLRPEQRATLAAGGTVTVAAQAGGTVRVLSYVPTADGRALRLSAAAGDLQEEVRERQQAFLGHLTALAVLGVAALLVVRRAPAGGAAPASTGALEAYEAAMGRLRDHGEEEKARHDAEKRRMEEAVREKEALARAGELTAGIVHEVRNGLGTIVGYARMLERGDAARRPGAGGRGRSGAAATAAEAGRAIREECDTLEVVVRRFHDFVRAEKLQLAAVDLGRLVTRVLARELRGRDVEGAVDAPERAARRAGRRGAARARVREPGAQRRRRRARRRTPRAT